MMLLDHGADYNIPHRTSGKLPLELAADSKGSNVEAVIKAFIQQDAQKS